MPRVEFENAVYHVMCRGNRREAIFREDADRELFLRTLAEACARTGWRIHAVVLMSNHYHFLLETPEANLVRGMHWFQATYTIRFNARHRLVGHVFSGRYKALVIDPEDRGHFATVSDYIHLNPARARLCEQGRLVNYAWSSLKWYGMAPRKRPRWLSVRSVLGGLGYSDRATDRGRYVARLEERALEGSEAGNLQELKRGWILGNDTFKERILEMMERTDAKASTERTFRRDHGERVAEAIIREGLAQFGIDVGGMEGLAKGDWRKRVLGHVVKRETCASLSWICSHLHMGSPGYASRMCSNLGDLAKRRDVQKVLKRLTCSKIVQDLSK